MAHRSDDWLIANVHNTARYFTEHPHIAWMTLVATLIWGVVGYLRMPQRKDPDVPVKVAMAIGRWPGVEAVRVEQLVARRLEETIAENVTVKEITSTSRLGVTFVLVTLKEEVDDPAKEFDDIKLRLDGITDLPQGAQPVEFIRDFGSTAALMLTVASPKASEVFVSIKAEAIEAAIRRAREAADGGAGRATLVYASTASVPAAAIRPAVDLFLEDATRYNVFRDARAIAGPGFVGVDGITSLSDSAILAFTEAFVRRTLRASEFHPDAWPAVVIRDPGDTRARLMERRGEKYSYRELERYTDLIRRSLQGIPIVTKVGRSGLLEEQVLLSFSQQRLASYGVAVTRLKDVLSARNIPLSGGAVDVEGKLVAVAPTGEFQNDREIGDVVLGSSRNGAPLYLRDLVDVDRTYATPASYLNYFSSRRRQRPLGAEPRRDPERRDARGRQDRRVRGGSGRHARGAPGPAARGPDLRADVRPAAPGRGERRPVHGQPDGGHRPGGHRGAARLLGVALGAAHGAGHSAYPGDDVRDDERARHRRAAGVDRVAHHRAGPPGRRPGRRGRRHQARPRPGAPVDRRRVARADQAGDRDPLRHHHQHRGVSPVPAAHG